MTGKIDRGIQEVRFEGGRASGEAACAIRSGVGELAGMGDDLFFLSLSGLLYPMPPS
ncbi:hypothetical protein [Paenibacillus apiarius]|uniref:hypothetical protein n=1 Tax=Paenibacillus apiarius TaxID=46240 RepID=UPI001F0900B5|nr:hypothetical protein [Paenibacillus apiarius]